MLSYLPFYHSQHICCSVTQLCLTLCDPMDCSTPGFPVLHYLSEFAQTHVHWVSDAIQPSHPLLPPYTPALTLSQHQSLFQWTGSSNQVAKVVELQLQHQSVQWISGLISFRIAWSKGLSRVFSSSTIQNISSLALSLLYGPTLTSIYDYWKNHSFH